MQYENWDDFVGGNQPYRDPTNGQFTRKDCQHNQIKLAYKDGAILRGLSGAVHNAMLNELPGLNVFLAPSELPLLYMYANCATDLIQEPPKHRIIFFPVRDQRVPESKAEFALLLEALLKELHAGGQVNVSCIGGHGRTGLVLAVLHGLLLGSKNPIEDIRAAYCSTAVESFMQECFVHEWLGLERPREVVKMCNKCRKFEQELKKNGERDAWCAPCNRVWEAENVARRAEDAAKAANKSTSTQTGIIPFRQHNIGPPAVDGSAIKCRTCWVRNPQSDSLWCLTCSFDLGPQDLPQERPDGWSKKAWKRLLKAVQGHSHSPAATTAIIGSIPPLLPDVQLQAAAKSQAEMERYAYLSELHFAKMTEAEWQDWLRLEFGKGASA